MRCYGLLVSISELANELGFCQPLIYLIYLIVKIQNGLFIYCDRVRSTLLSLLLRGLASSSTCHGGAVLMEKRTQRESPRERRGLLLLLLLLLFGK